MKHIIHYIPKQIILAVFAVLVTAGMASAQYSPAYIEQILREYQALFGQTSSYTYTRNLTIGSSGADVRALQSFLISRGYSIPAGATGYFGYQTRGAVAAYQRMAGIVPAVGYFGPITRAYIQRVVVPLPPPIPVPNPGAEGELRDFDQEGDVETSLEEGDSDVKVLGVSFSAWDSDMTVDRLDVEFEKTDGDGSAQLDQYIDSVSLWVDGKKVTDIDVEDIDENDDTYSVRFTNLDVDIEEGDEATVYVAVDVTGNIDSADEDVEWEVTIPEDGIRARDEANISETYGPEDYTETFSFGEAQTATLDISDSGDNDDKLVIVSDDNTTYNVELLSIELEANRRSMVIQDLPVSILATGNGDIEDIVSSIRLMSGSKVLETASVSGAGDFETMIFDNLDFELDEGDTVTLKVVADIRRVSGSFEDGDTLTASTTENLSGWDVEDSEGDDVTLDGHAVGGDITFSQNGIVTKLVGTNEQKTFTADEAGESDRGEFRITFDLTALEDDVYIDRSVTNGASGNPGNGTLWATTSDSTTGTTVTSYVFAADSDSSDTSMYYKVSKGDTRRLTLVVALRADTDGVAGVQLNGVNWTTNNQDTTADNFYTVNLDNYKTGILSLYDY